jgi:hypothetical protein
MSEAHWYLVFSAKGERSSSTTLSTFLILDAEREGLACLVDAMMTLLLYSNMR